MRNLGLAFLTLCFSAAFPTPSSPSSQNVDQKKIDAAVSKGIQYLWTRFDEIKSGKVKSDRYHIQYSSLELVLYTAAHAGVPATDDRMKSLIALVLTEQPSQKETYNLAIEAMALTMIDRKKHKDRLADLAQALIDTQSKSGGWGYGGSGPQARRRKNLPQPANPKQPPSKTPGPSGTDVVKKIERKQWGVGTEDNS